MTNPRKALASILCAALVVLVCAPASSGETAAAALAGRPEVAATLQVLDAWIAQTVRDREQPGLSKDGSQAGEVIRFEVDAAGNVTRMSEPGDYVLRQNGAAPR